MITKNEIKRIKNLRKKKDRKELKLFVAEGEKTVLDLLNAGWQTENLYTLSSLEALEAFEATQISEKDMSRLTFLKSASTALGVFIIPEQQAVSYQGRILVLDGITDPGNLGTIIRIAAWFGIATIVCSLNTVDCYNPKVVQATMGSLANMNCVYTDLVSFLNNTDKPIYAASMEGSSVYETPLDQDGILIMGSESQGISKPLQVLAQNHITIPRFGSEKAAESLNVAVAAAIILGQAFRP